MPSLKTINTLMAGTTASKRLRQNDGKKTALMLVDIQHDFLPGGALAVTDGDKILPAVYDLLDRFEWDLVVASADYHPEGHVSFASTHAKEPFTQTTIPEPRSKTGATLTQDLWPDHCVQGTHGGDFDAGVQSRLDASPAKVVVIRKGSNLDIDSYSAFADNAYQVFTALPKALYSSGIERLVVVGLATDFCVRATAIDSRKFDFETIVIRDGVRGVFADREEAVLSELSSWGAQVKTLGEYENDAS